MRWLRDDVLKRRTLLWMTGLSIILAAGVVLLVRFLFVTQTQTACMAPGISCPASADIVNGPITVNASQYNFYQFGLPYGAQDVNVHVQWSSGGSIIVYVVNATELINWQSGHALDSFYKSGQSAQGDVTLRLPADDLYYLVFDNTFSAVQKNVQTSSGFSFMCSLCGASGPIQHSSGPTCVQSDGDEVCSVTLSNIGSTDASPTGYCIQSWSLHEGPVETWGAPHLGIFFPNTQIPHFSNLTATCTVAGTTVPLGLAITVLIPFTDGNNVVMYGPVSLNAPGCTQSGNRLVCTFSINNKAATGVVATACQIEVGDNVSRWTGTVGGTTVFNSDNQGKLFTCSVVGSEPPIGTPVTGSVRFSDGSYSLFSGKWS